MFPFLIALFWALISPAYNHTNCGNNNAQVSTMNDGDDTGGETGTIPPKPPGKG